MNGKIKGFLLLVAGPMNKRKCMIPKYKKKCCEKSDKNQCLNSKVLELMDYDYKRMDHSFSLSDFIKLLDKLENLIVLLMRTFFL